LRRGMAVFDTGSSPHVPVAPFGNPLTNELAK
jgi:hypothetical protein